MHGTFLDTIPFKFETPLLTRYTSRDCLKFPLVEFCFFTPRIAIDLSEPTNKAKYKLNLNSNAIRKLTQDNHHKQYIHSITIHSYTTSRNIASTRSLQQYYNKLKPSVFTFTYNLFKFLFANKVKLKVI